MDILVTGGCGFIGSHFVRLALEKGCHVLNVDALTYAGNLANVADIAQNPHYTFHKADIADKATVEAILAAHKLDAIVHFAAESHVDRSIHDSTPFIRTNVLGTQNLVDLARAYKVPRFVHVSTDEVYGSLPLDKPQLLFTESTPIAPNSPYAASKAASDLLCRACYETYGQDIVITRCSNNYGPNQFPEKLIPLITRRALANQPLPVYGDGLNQRDWIHVADHCQGVYLALTRGKAGEVYNFGGASEKSNIHVVQEILRILGKPDTLIHYVKDRPGHDRRYAMDFSHAAATLGFAPGKIFAQGLEETVQWYAAHENWVRDIESGAYLAFEQIWYKDRV